MIFFVKKHPIFLPLSFLLISALSGCGNPVFPGKANPLFGTMEYEEEATRTFSHMRHLDDAGALRKLIDQKADFLFLVIGKNHTTCGCYTAFHEILVKFQKANHVLFYYLTSDEMGEESYGLNYSATYATLGVFKDGQLAYSHDDSDDTSKWNTDYTTFASWIKERVNLPRLFYVSRAQLNDLYYGDEAFTIYFGRSECSDCAYLEKTAYKTYFAERQNNIQNSYAIDMDSVGIGKIEIDGVIHNRQSDAEVGTPAYLAQVQYDAFKEEYGLTEGEDNPVGYGAGYVPAIYHVNPDASGSGQKRGDVIDMAGVFLNDVIDETGTITASYFDEARLKLDALDYLEEAGLEPHSLVGKKIEGESAEEKKAGLLALQKDYLTALLDASIGVGIASKDGE